MEKVYWSVICQTRRQSPDFWTSKAISFLSLIFLASSAMMFAGCALTRPSLTLSPGAGPMASAPTVGDLVDHIACEIGKTYEDHQKKNVGDHQEKNDSDHWQYLLKDNFVASVQLTLLVTQNEALNASLSWITPFYGAKQPPAASFSSVLAVGAQLGGTQDYSVTQNYNMDIRNLIYLYEKNADADPAQRENPSFPYCNPRDGKSHFSNLHSPLQGNMQLEETIQDGLTALNISSQYNIYGSSGPKDEDDVHPEQHPEQQPKYHNPKLLLVPEIEGMKENALSGGGPKTGGATGGASTGANQTTFGSVVDFYITGGLGAGWNVSLPHHKWSLGSSSTSGGGSGGGGNSGGGSSGGGGGGPLNYSRQTQDSLNITFGATCSAPDRELSGISEDPHSEKDLCSCDNEKKCPRDENKKPDKDTDSCNKVTKKEKHFYGTFTEERKPKYYELTITFTLPTHHTPQPMQSSSDRLTIFSDEARQNETAFGTVMWTGWASSEGFSVRGTVTNPFGVVIGQIAMDSNQNGKKLRLRHFPDTDHLESALRGQSPNLSYWDLIPACDTMTVNQNQNAINTVNNSNVSQGLRSAIFNLLR